MAQMERIQACFAHGLCIVISTFSSQFKFISNCPTKSCTKVYLYNLSHATIFSVLPFPNLRFVRSEYEICITIIVRIREGD